MSYYDQEPDEPLPSPEERWGYDPDREAEADYYQDEQDELPDLMSKVRTEHRAESRDDRDVRQEMSEHLKARDGLY